MVRYTDSTRWSAFVCPLQKEYVSKELQMGVFGGVTTLAWGLSFFSVKFRFQLGFRDI